MPNRKEGRTLVIVGEAGSGKTTILLKLLNSLINEAEKDPQKRIPVVFNLSSWTNKKLKIEKWLVEQLKEQYKLSDKSIIEDLIKNQHLILLLDGLDEVEENARNTCVEYLNDFMKTHELTDVVVSCRRKEYQEYSTTINLQSVIDIQPLTSKQIGEYLKQAGESLAALTTLVEQNPELKKLATSPLNLSVMSLTYKNYTLEDLKKTGLLTDFYPVLFNNYIDQMLHRRQIIDKRYSRSQLINWLIWLSQQMSKRSETKFSIEKMQPYLLESKTQRLTYYFTVLLISGILSSLTGFVHIPLQPVDNYKYALATGLLSGLCVPLYYIWNYLFDKYWHKNHKNIDEINLVEKLDWSLGERINNLMKNLPISLMIGLIAAYPCAWLEIEGKIDLYKKGIEKNIIGHSDSINLMLLILIYTFLVGFFIMFIYGLTSDLPAKEIPDEIYPNQGIFISLQNSLLIGLIDFIVTGLFFFLIGYYIQAHEMIQALKYGVGYGFIAAVFFTICSSSGQTCIKHFALRLILYKNKLIPWNYAKFLNDASEILFLRKVGISYEFFHKKFQEYLANEYRID